MNLPTSDQLAYSTVRLECIQPDGTISTGTGFMFRLLETAEEHMPVLITNRHVVSGANRARLCLHRRREAGVFESGPGHWVEITNFQDTWVGHPDESVDLALIRLDRLLPKLEVAVQPLYVQLSKSLLLSDEELARLTAVEEILMVGYPNGLWDEANNLPIMRRGITATHPAKDYCGRKEFLIDCAVFPGSSGSPVLLFNVGTYFDGRNAVVGSRVKLLGVVHAVYQHSVTGDIEVIEVPTEERAVAVSRVPNHLGVVIRAERLLDFDAHFRDMLNKDGG